MSHHEEEAPKHESHKQEEHKMVKKTSSPYELNSNDNMGNLITQVKLQGNNYEECAHAMKISLHACRKWGFIKGTIGAPNEGSPKMEDWWTVKSMLVSWILNTIEPNLRSTMSYVENAKELWTDIKERLFIVNGPRIQQLKSDLARCKQDDMTVVAYYRKLKTMWDEEERVHQFLMGLDDATYGTVRFNLLATDMLPTLNRVYLTMIQEERVRMITRTTEERREVMSLAI